MLPRLVLLYHLSHSQTSSPFCLANLEQDPSIYVFHVAGMTGTDYHTQLFIS
jgi:hypothetical protein